jgi:VCBS repeat-containing protein
VTVSDGSGGSDSETVTITITGNNDAPVMTGATSGAVEENGTLMASGDLNYTDIDIGDTATWSGGGTGSYGTLGVDSTGLWTYTLANASPAVQGLGEGQTVTDTFVVTVSDGSGGSDSETVTITITGDQPNVAPNAVDDPETVIRGGTLIDSVATNDTDADPLTFTLLTSPTRGSLVFNLNGSYIYTNNGVSTSGDSFTYEASDGSLTDTATVTITVTQPVIRFGTNGPDIVFMTNPVTVPLLPTPTAVTNGDDYLFGESAAYYNFNIQNGSPDSLIGGLGNDTLDGGWYADTMEGGAGNDTYIVQDPADLTVESPSGGSDLVRSSAANYTLMANVENLILTGTGNINGTGNGENNLVIGNTGNNILKGEAGADLVSGGLGADTIDGGLGTDTLTGGAGADIFVFSTVLAGNVDQITDFDATTDKIRLVKSVFGTLGADGVLAAGAFSLDPLVLTADTRIIYNSTSGALLYDSDGSGGTGAVQFASVTVGLVGVDATDFIVATA